MTPKMTQKWVKNGSKIGSQNPYFQGWPVLAQSPYILANSSVPHHDSRTGLGPYWPEVKKPPKKGQKWPKMVKNGHFLDPLFDPLLAKTFYPGRENRSRTCPRDPIFDSFFDPFFDPKSLEITLNGEKRCSEIPLFDPFLTPFLATFWTTF
jgi:hypothetical protein